MHAYTASLTNAARKVLEPKTIIVNQRLQLSKTQKALILDTPSYLNQLRKDSKKMSKPIKKSRKTIALEAAAAIKAAKT